MGEQEVLGDAINGIKSPAGEGSLKKRLKVILHLMPKVRTMRMLGISAMFFPG